MEKSLLQSVWPWSALVVTIIGIPMILWLLPPPFFASATIKIDRGTSITEAAKQLTDAGVVYTPELITVPFFLTGETLTAGTYQFDQSINAVDTVDRLASGDFGIAQSQVVISEGFTNEQIAARIEDELGEENFSAQTFRELAQPHEGYLYPDTYRLHPDATAEEVIALMRENFDRQIKPLQSEISSFDQSREAVLKMASLVELEAANYEIRRRIAGVLWRRLELGMPLQVDAAFVSLLGKNTYELTRSDLKTESPYNLYTNIGLPPTPIANPGKSAIKAVVNPIKGEDLYYLSDRSGNFYFAEDLENHNQNKRDFLDS